MTMTEALAHKRPAYHRVSLWLFLILLAGAGLRFNPWVGQRSLHVDEAYSWRVASAPTWGETFRMGSDEIDPPLYYIMLRLWMALLGESEWALRSLSGLFGLLTVGAAFAFAWLWAEPDPPARRRGPTLVASALVAVNLPLVVFSMTARMFAPMAFFAVASSALLLRAVETPRFVRWWMMYVPMAAMLCWLHNYGPILVAGQILWLALRTIRERDGTHRRLLWSRGLCSLALIVALYAPWLPELLRQVQVVRSGFWAESLSWDLAGVLPIQWVQEPLWSLYSFNPLWYENIVYGLLTLAILWPWRMGRCEFLLGLIVLVHAGAFVAFDLVGGRSVVAPRYLVYLFPLIAAPVAYWLWTVPPLAVRIPALAVLLGASACSTVISLAHSAETDTASRWLAETLAGRLGPDEPVIYSDKDDFLICGYYLHRLGQRGVPSYTTDASARVSEFRYSPLAGAIRPGEVLLSLDDTRLGGRRIWIVKYPGLSIPQDWELLETIGPSLERGEELLPNRRLYLYKAPANSVPAPVGSAKEPRLETHRDHAGA